MPTLIRQAVRRLAFTAVEQLEDLLNREIVPVLHKAREIINARHGFVRDTDEDYTLEVGDEEVRVDTTDAPATITLPLTAPEGLLVYVTKASSDGNAVTVIEASGAPPVTGVVSIATLATAGLRYDANVSRWRRVF